MATGSSRPAPSTVTRPAERAPPFPKLPRKVPALGFIGQTWVTGLSRSQSLWAKGWNARIAYFLGLETQLVGLAAESPLYELR